VFRIDPKTGSFSVAYTGFTNIIGLTTGTNGDLDVLEISTNGLASPKGPGPGTLIQIDPTTGLRTTILQNLVSPTGLAAGPDGTLYVSDNGLSPTQGEVLSIQPLSPVPEPGSWALLGSGLLTFPAWAIARRMGRGRALRPIVPTG